MNIERAEIAKLELKPGDILVLKFAGRVATDVTHRARAALQQALDASGHHDTEILVVDQNATLSVMTHGEVPAHHPDRAYLG